MIYAQKKSNGLRYKDGRFVFRYAIVILLTLEFPGLVLESKQHIYYTYFKY